MRERDVVRGALASAVMWVLFPVLASCGGAAARPAAETTAPPRGSAQVTEGEGEEAGRDGEQGGGDTLSRADLETLIAALEEQAACQRGDAASCLRRGDAQRASLEGDPPPDVEIDAVVEYIHGCLSGVATSCTMADWARVGRYYARACQLGLPSGCERAEQLLRPTE